jgi:DtxR family Mn-dependent transcriptional regulator|tara:strand:- start:3465 stop:4133 length:669 start_codon:yes stop_codon:yes gene_type:complete
MPNIILTKSEEDYIKAIFNLSEFGNKQVSTNSISKVLKIEPASVTDMIKKLSHKKLIYHQKYKGCKISKNGMKIALQIIRKHRLWEVFLHDKLKFKWDKIHDIAEQLEHISSNKLIDRLDDFLNYPKIDPHGDPIPNKLGVIESNEKISLFDLENFDSCIVARIIKEDQNFFKLLKKLNIEIGTKIKVLEKLDYDDSLEIIIENKKILISNKIASNIKVSKI